MVDPLGTALAIPGLILLAAQTYNSVRDVITSYRKLDQTMEEISGRITMAEMMFGQHIRTLLKDVVSEEDVVHLLQKPNRHSISDQLDLKLIEKEISESLSNPDLGNILARHIKEVCDILKEVKASLSEDLAKRTSETSNSPAHKGSNTSVVHTMQLNFRRMRQGVQRKSKHFLKNTNGELDQRLKRLTQINSELNECHHLIVSQPTLYTGHHTLPSTSILDLTSGLGLERYEKAPDGVRRTAEVSKLLYDTLSKLPHCPCHLLYLCLETRRGIIERSPSNSISENTVELDNGIRFSVLVTSNPGTQFDNLINNPAIHEQQNLCQEVLLNFDQTAIPTNSGPTSVQIPKLCGKHLVDCNEQQYALGSFLVQQVTDRPKCERDEIPSAITLRDLLYKYKSRMAIADKLFLTVKLGYAVLSFYSSPWIKLWNAQQISFLAEYEFSSHPGDWSPHLMTLVTSNNSAAPNSGDIYRFGLLLFEIAGVSSSALQELRMGFERLENTPHPWPVGTVNSINALIKIESRKLMMIFGKFLKHAVQDCFGAYFALAQNSGNTVYETKMFELRRRFERLEEWTRDSYEDLL